MASTLQNNTNGEIDIVDSTIFKPKFFDRMGLKGFEIRNLSVKNKHAKNLEDSIRARGYDEDKPVIVASSEDPEANGYVLDGRHRLLACYWIWKDTGKLPPITTKHEPIDDLAQAKSRQIYYEAQHLLNKPSEDAAEHIMTLYEDLKILDPSIKSQHSLEQYFSEEAHFDNETVLKALVHRIDRYEKKKLDTAKDTVKRQDGSRDETASKSWGSGAARDTRGASSSSSAATAAVEVKVPTFRELTGEIELICHHGKKMNVSVAVRVFDNGKVELEPVAL